MSVALLSIEEFEGKLLEIRDARMTENTLCIMDYNSGVGLLAGSLKFTWVEKHKTFFELTVDGESGYIDFDPQNATSIYYYQDEETGEDTFTLCNDNGAEITLHIGVVE
jgi:predicted dehydrogenase